MAESSWPSPTHSAGSVNDLEYEQMSHPANPDGLVGTPADSSLIYGDSTGRLVKVRNGRFGKLRGHLWYSGTSDFTKTIAANSSGSTRVDLIVLRLTRSTWDVTVEVRAGTPGAGVPAAVRDLGTTGVYEIELASVTVTNGAALITAGNVTNLGWYLADDGSILATAATLPPVAAVGPGVRAVDTSANTLYRSTTSAWLVGAEGQIAYRVSDTTVVNNSTTAVNVSGMSLPVEANRVYRLTGLILYEEGGSSSGSDIKISWTFPAGAFLSWAWTGPNITATDMAASLSGYNAYSASTSGSGFFISRGYEGSSRVGAPLLGLLRMGSTSGTLQLQAAQNAAVAVNLIVGEGSFIELVARV